MRAALLRAIRSFFHEQNFLEVDTPVRQPVLIPEATIEPLKSESWFLQTSPEQCMKRLLTCGSERIFQICPCFRAKERGRTHLEEFTMLEWYRVAGDYKDLMDDCQRLLRYICTELLKEHIYRYHIERSCFGKIVLAQQWERITVHQAFAAHSPVSVEKALSAGTFDEILVEYVEPHLGYHKPLFLYDYPAECASLARKKHDSPNVAERFELYINGLELANGFSELTDPAEQRVRFEKELAVITRIRGEGADMPEQFLEDLDKLEGAAGIAFGVDRLLMLLMSAQSIEQVVSISPSDW